MDVMLMMRPFLLDKDSSAPRDGANARLNCRRASSSILPERKLCEILFVAQPSLGDFRPGQRNSQWRRLAENTTSWKERREIVAVVANA
jgi:hypothetical protein